MASSSAFGSCLTNCLRSSKALSTRRSTGPGRRGWISSEWGGARAPRRASFDTLTKAGSKQGVAEEESWDGLALAIAKVRKSNLRRLMMKWFNILMARLRALFRRESVLRDIEEELRVHVEMETETNIKRGMSPDEARAKALKSFGNLSRKTELGYEDRKSVVS